MADDHADSAGAESVNLAVGLLMGLYGSNDAAARSVLGMFAGFDGTNIEVAAAGIVSDWRLRHPDR